MRMIDTVKEMLKKLLNGMKLNDKKTLKTQNKTKNK